jgi:hypothetical protein
LTRSGLIAMSTFAQSNIGKFSLVHGLPAPAAGLVVWRLPRMRSRGVRPCCEAAFLATTGRSSESRCSSWGHSFRASPRADEPASTVGPRFTTPGFPRGLPSPSRAWDRRLSGERPPQMF